MKFMKESGNSDFRLSLVCMTSFKTIYGNVMQWISYPMELEYFSRFEMERVEMAVTRIKSKKWTQLRRGFSHCYRRRRPRELWETSTEQLPTDVFCFLESQDLRSCRLSLLQEHGQGYGKFRYPFFFAVYLELSTQMS